MHRCPIWAKLYQLHTQTSIWHPSAGFSSGLISSPNGTAAARAFRSISRRARSPSARQPGSLGSGGILISSVAELRGTTVSSVGGHGASRSQAKQSGEVSRIVPANGQHARTPSVTCTFPRAGRGWREAGPKPHPEGGRRPAEGEPVLGAPPPVCCTFGRTCPFPCAQLSLQVLLGTYDCDVQAFLCSRLYPGELVQLAELGPLLRAT